jgi:hypothetical protein
MIQEHINPPFFFDIDIDTSNQEIAINSVVKIVKILSNEFNDDFDISIGYIKIIRLITEVVKEVESVSTIYHKLSSIDKKQIAVHLGYLVLAEIYKSKPELFNSYIKLYKENVEPTLEMIINVSKVVNITNPELNKKINGCCNCF